MHDTNERTDFLADMRRSRKGNLWRRTDDGRTATIFVNKYGAYSWCIADGTETQFSRHSFASERDAAADLLEHLDVEGY